MIYGLLLPFVYSADVKRCNRKLDNYEAFNDFKHLFSIRGCVLLLYLLIIQIS